MSRAEALSALLDDPRIWRGRKTGHVPGGASTGRADLDALLPGGGWPRHGVSEILLSADGLGELALVLPALAALGDRQHPVVLVDPPYLPFPLAWRQHGVRASHLVTVDSAGHDSLWAAEQCLRSGVCPAVLVWPRRIDPTRTKRLQLAAETGRAMAFVFRDARHAGEASPAALRLLFHGQQLQVLKCRGRTPPARALPARRPMNALPEQEDTVASAPVGTASRPS